VFVDEARIYVEGGHGGDGAVAFRREKFVPRGGPAGGDGGHGGSVVFLVDSGLGTLMDFRHQTHFRAEPGQAGGNSNKSGRQGQDTIVRVPPGTLVLTEDGHLLADLTEPGQRHVVAHGGRGGRGNAHFSSASHRVPRIAERGQPGEALWVRLELRLLADVGLVGYPNVGKSTLISRMSSARPRVADYPFTTLQPNLGVVSTFGDPFVMADVPGLIEGAHQGLGLGHGFLRHLKRTRVLVHLVDMNPMSDRDPLADYRVIRHELEAFSPRLARRPEIVVATKMDVTGAEERLRAFQAGIAKMVYPISAVTGAGVEALGYALRAAIDNTAAEPPEERPPVVKPRVTGWTLEPQADGVRLVGDVEERAVMTRWGHYEDEAFLAEYLRRRGVWDALRKRDLREGTKLQVGPGALLWIEESLVPVLSREAAEFQSRELEEHPEG
jgi:GTP-binding protein